MGAFHIPNVGNIEQQTPTPMEPRRIPYAQAPRLISPLGEAGSRIEEEGKQLGNILALQGRQKQVLDSAQADEDLKSQFGQVFEDARTMPGDQQAQYVKDNTQKIADAMLKDPNNAHIAPFLQKRIPMLQGLYIGEAQRSGAAATMQAHTEQLKSLNTNSANDIARQFDPATFQDTTGATLARNQADARIDQTWPNDPMKQAAFKQDLENKIAPARAQYIAQNQPEAIDKYLKSTNYPFSAEQIQNFQTISRNAIEKPYHDAQAAHDATVAQTNTDLNKLAQDKSPDLYQQAYAASKAGYITHERFEDLTNTKWQGPKAVSDPSTMAFWQKKIQTDPTSVSTADISAIDKDTISPGDRATLRASLDDTMKGVKQGMTAQYLRSRSAIREALTPSIMVNPENTRMRIEGALSDLDAAYKGGELKSPQDIQNIQNAILKANGPKVPRKSPVVHITAPGGVPIPPAIAAKVAAEARSKNFEAGPPGGE